ncbi:MAG: DUF3329 domain-containing protein [Gammaproteobacteria bacterium]|nr:DUF3329 domain-containing protein [Gammaproteobacteria bacterium]
MNFHPYFRFELQRIALWASAAAVIGLLLDRLELCLLLTCTLYLIWHLYHLNQLILWASQSGHQQLPNGSGVWGEVEYHLRKMHRASSKRESRLNRQVRRFQLTTASLPLGLVLLGRNRTIEWFNTMAAEHLRLNENLHLGRQLDKVLREQNLVDWLEAITTQRETLLSSPLAEEQILELKLSIFSKKRGLLLMRDVTREKNLQQMRQDFVTNASHELKTPLTVINGYLETLCDAEIEPTPIWQERLKRSLNQMQEHSQRMKQIIDDLLYLSRMEKEEIERHTIWLNPGAMIHEITRGAQMFDSEKELQFSVCVQPELTMLGDPEEIYSVINNLVTNAIKYTPKGGKITIIWESCLLRQTRVSQALLEEIGACGGYLAVEDNGIGIAPIHHSRLTERFYRVESRRCGDTGTGLGLAIVKHILKHHDSSLHLRSRQGEGSLFFCGFPLNRVSHR